MIVCVSRNKSVCLQTSESTIMEEWEEAEHKGKNSLVESRGEVNYPAFFQINATTLLIYPVNANVQHDFLLFWSFEITCKSINVSHIR